MVAMVAHAIGDHENAVKAYLSALDLEPDNPETHQGLAVAYEALGRPTDALSHWDTWLSLAEEAGADPQKMAGVRDRMAVLSAP